MTEVVPQESGDKKATLYCSFCAKSQHQVRKLIAGPTAFICDECVQLSLDILTHEGMLGHLLALTFGLDVTQRRLEAATFSSVGALLREGGLEKRKGPYTLFEVACAMSNVLDVRLRPPNKAEKEKLAAKAELERQISGRELAAARALAEELRPLKEKLAALG